MIRAAIAVGAHYLDLADASAFVAGVGALDQTAKDKAVFVLSGVSSFPVLTAAVVRRLAQDMEQVSRSPAGLRRRRMPTSVSTSCKRSPAMPDNR